MKSKFIKITNTADFVPRIALEKLGLSMKRNDPNTIGQFGSGIKFAPIAAVRRGWDWVFVGEDQQGPYKLRYREVEESGIKCIEYDYGDYQKSSSFTLDAGSLSWIDPFQIYREAVANAMDGAFTSGGEWNISIVDSVGDHIPNEFSVYITAAPEIMAIHNSFDKYFSNNRRVEKKTSPTSSVLESYDNGLKIYCHNVLVGDYENYESLFDYNFDDIQLNEERTVKSEWSLKWSVYYTLQQATDSTIKQVIKAAIDGKDVYELDAINTCTDDNNCGLSKVTWQRVFSEMFGEHAVAIKSDLFDSHSYQLKLRKKLPVAVPSGAAYTLMSRVGIPTMEQVISEEVSYDIEYDLSKYPRLQVAMDICASAEPEFASFMDRIFPFHPKMAQEVIGLTINFNKPSSERVILIDSTHATVGSLEQIVATLLHEFDHAHFGIKDASDQNGRQFRDLADTRIGRLVCENYGNHALKLVDNFVAFDPERYSEIGSEIFVQTCAITDLVDGILIKTSRNIYMAIRHWDNDAIDFPESTRIEPQFDNKIGKFVLTELGKIGKIKIV